MEYTVYLLVWRDRNRGVSNANTYWTKDEADMAYEGCTMWPENDAELMEVTRGSKVEVTIYISRNF